MRPLQARRGAALPDGAEHRTPFADWPAARRVRSFRIAPARQLPRPRAGVSPGVGPSLRPTSSQSISRRSPTACTRSTPGLGVEQGGLRDPGATAHAPRVPCVQRNVRGEIVGFCRDPLPGAVVYREALDAAVIAFPGADDPALHDTGFGKR